MIMARFWLGLPADGLRFGWSVLAHAVVFMVWSARKACAGLWWAAMPPGLDHCDFPTWHFITRAFAFSFLGGWFLHAPLLGHMMESKPNSDEALAWCFAWFALVAGAAIATIGNLVLATCLRGTDSSQRY